jgi:hypothetical protein
MIPSTSVFFPGGLRPGDHAGCNCDVILVWTPAAKAVPPPGVVSPGAAKLANVKMDDAFRPDVTAALDMIEHRVPGMLKGLTVRTKTRTSRDPGASAEYGKSDMAAEQGSKRGTVTLYTSVLKKAAPVEQSEKVTGGLAGWNTRTGATSKVYRTVVHELGHRLDYAISPADRATLLDTVAGVMDVPRPAKYDRDTLDAWMRTHRYNVLSTFGGRYASTNDRELMAEIWASYALDPEPRPEIARVGEVFVALARKAFK